MTGVVPAGDGDLAALLSLLSAEHLHEDLGSHADTVVMVVREGEAVVGGVALEVYGDSGLLRSLVVAPGSRGTGLGQALVDGVVAEARRRGLRDLSLLTLTVPGFFERYGFRRVERHAAPAAVQESHEFAVLCPHDAVAMTRDL